MKIVIMTDDGEAVDSMQLTEQEAAQVWRNLTRPHGVQINNGGPGNTQINHFS